MHLCIFFDLFQRICHTCHSVGDSAIKKGRVHFSAHHTAVRRHPNPIVHFITIAAHLDPIGSGFIKRSLCYAQERLRTRVQEIAASRSSRCPFHTAFGQQNQAEAVACQIKAPIALITNQSLASLLRIAEEKVIYITDTQHRLGHQVAKRRGKTDDANIIPEVDICPSGTKATTITLQKVHDTAIGAA